MNVYSEKVITPHSSLLTVMTCPDLSRRTELIYDSARTPDRRCPAEWKGLDHLPRPHTCDRPPTCLPQGHYMLAWDDHAHSYYIYCKCIWQDDARLMANSMIAMQLATHIQIYELHDPFRQGYICDALVFLLDGVLPQRTVSQTWTDLMHIFRCLIVARGYVPKVYYDDVDEDLPVTSHTPWRPRRPKTGRGWHEMLNLPCTAYGNPNSKS